MKRLLVIGSGGQGKVVMDCAEHQYDSITFMTNDQNAKKNIGNYPVVFENEISFEDIRNNYDELIVAIGDNDVRLRLSLEYESKGLKLATIVHKSAVVSKYAQIGAGSVVFAGGVINPFAHIGKACIINTNAVVEHDCLIKDGVHISPNAAMGGNCYIGERTWICIGSSISDNIKIGDNSVVGAGSVVIDNIPENVLIAGVPAVIKRKCH